ncbi:hypothetical protein F5X68DRAFT_59557 [Plectosphaerella plurivora]|uniref:Uncharacterized protein n=1 Tax=Plectosphaerella plurivora TaxID=936078 RepID=A0A9P8VIC7_9PEZI|nr:hypothetical protein F5X68DRAFT_59557 [Plectosphaerella plurivora]
MRCRTFFPDLFLQSSCLPPPGPLRGWIIIRRIGPGPEDLWAPRPTTVQRQPELESARWRIACQPPLKPPQRLVRNRSRFGMSAGPELDQLQFVGIAAPGDVRWAWPLDLSCRQAEPSEPPNSKTVAVQVPGPKTSQTPGHLPKRLLAWQHRPSRYALRVAKFFKSDWKSSDVDRHAFPGGRHTAIRPVGGQHRLSGTRHLQSERMQDLRGPGYCPAACSSCHGPRGETFSPRQTGPVR